MNLTPPAQLQNGHEDVDDVHVQRDGREDVLLGRDGILLAADDLLGVVHQEEREEQSHQRRVDGVGDGPVTGQEEDAQDAENEENPTSREQVHAHACIDKDKYALRKDLKSLYSPVKSHLVWNEKRVSPKHRAAVMPMAIMTHQTLW